MNYRIRYGGALIGWREIWAIMKCVLRNWWQLDKEGLAMEREAAEQLGVRYGLLANSGSSAGLLALASLELPQGSKVIIPAVTFPTIFNIILQLGHVPVVADCEIGTYNLDLDQVEKIIKKEKNIKAIIAVHAVGNPVDMPRLMDLVQGKGIKVLEDNCDGWGGTIGGKKLGSFGDVSFTSFHAAHIVAMGEGGGVFTDDPVIAKNARMYRDWGRQADVSERINGGKWPTLPDDYDPRFIYEKIGWNLKPLELQAAMGRVQLRKADDIKRLRRNNWRWLSRELSRFPDLIMPKVVKDADPCWFALPITTRGDRGKLVGFLEENGIETRSMFAGNITRHPAYDPSMYRIPYPLAQADEILTQSFWIGVHPRMTPFDRQYVLDVFKKYYAPRTS